MTRKHRPVHMGGNPHGRRLSSVIIFREEGRHAIKYYENTHEAPPPRQKNGARRTRYRRCYRRIFERIGFRREETKGQD